MVSYAASMGLRNYNRFLKGGLAVITVKFRNAAFLESMLELKLPYIEERCRSLLDNQSLGASIIKGLSKEGAHVINFLDCPFMQLQQIHTI